MVGTTRLNKMVGEFGEYKREGRCGRETRKTCGGSHSIWLIVPPSPLASKAPLPNLSTRNPGPAQLFLPSLTLEISSSSAATFDAHAQSPEFKVRVWIQLALFVSLERYDHAAKQYTVRSLSVSEALSFCTNPLPSPRVVSFSCSLFRFLPLAPESRVSFLFPQRSAWKVAFILDDYSPGNV
eukprot:593623-Rhodomonas_salina.1